MSNRPIPRKGLLGCWFLDDRGIAYNSGTNEAKDRSGRGNHATYQNGVTVGVEGDPAREFGASDFDASSSQYADVGDPLAVGDNNPHAVVSIFKNNTSGTENQNIVNTINGNNGFRLDSSSAGKSIAWYVNDGSGALPFVEAGQTAVGEFVCVVGAFSGSSIVIYRDGVLKETKSLSTYNSGQQNVQIGRGTKGGRYHDGEIAAIGRYDLSVPDAPEPSEIARKWDKLRDIPATR